MKNISKDELQKNRKFALILGSLTTTCLVIFVFIIVQITSDLSVQLFALTVSTIILVIFIVAIARYRRRKLRRC
jgi:L-asparagine transporter-like permease